MYASISSRNKDSLSRQVKDLGDLFESDYNFEVIRHVIDSTSMPEAALNYYLASFVHEYNKEGTLLIVYYAGHGWSNTVNNGNGGVEQEFHLTEYASLTLSTEVCTNAN
jgi:hypothetical protein